MFEIMSDCMFGNLIRLLKFLAFLRTMLLCNLNTYFIYECSTKFIVFWASICAIINIRCFFQALSKKCYYKTII